MFTGNLTGNTTGHIGAMNYGGFMAPIVTAGTISNTATTATANNIADTIVMRDTIGHFTTGYVTINNRLAVPVIHSPNKTLSITSDIAIGQGNNTNIISAPVGGNIVDVQEFTKQHVNPRFTRYQVDPQFIKYGGTPIKRFRKGANLMVHQELAYQDDNVNRGYIISWQSAVRGTCRFITDIDVVVDEDLALTVKIIFPRLNKKPTYLTFKTDIMYKNKINKVPFIGFRTPIPEHYIDKTLLPIIQFYNDAGALEYIPEKVSVSYIIPQLTECHNRDAAISKIFLHQTVISTLKETLVLKSPLLDERHKKAMNIITNRLIPAIKEWLYSPDGAIFKRLQAEFKHIQNSEDRYN